MTSMQYNVVFTGTELYNVTRKSICAPYTTLNIAEMICYIIIKFRPTYVECLSILLLSYLIDIQTLTFQMAERRLSKVYERLMVL